jgi:hypothetical protein
MHVDLSSDEADTLKGLLRDCLPDLRREIARTEQREFRHQLVVREELCETLNARLDKAGEQRVMAPPM